MLTKQILEYEDDLADINNRSILRRSEVAQIEKTSKLIKHQISELDTIDRIALEVGLTTNKLQEGFQNLLRVYDQWFHTKSTLGPNQGSHTVL